MKTYKYVDATNQVVTIIDSDGISRGSCLASALDIGTQILPADPPNYAAEKAVVLSQARELREKILNRLTGIQLNTTNLTYITAMQTARQALLDFPTNAAVVAAITGAQTKTAIMAIWYQTGTTLTTAAPPAATAFTGMGL